MDGAVARGRSRLVVLSAALALGGCIIPVATGPAPPPAEPTVETAGCSATRGQAVLERVNAIRAERGLPRLGAELRLAEAADGHSADQADNGGTMTHTGSDGSGPGDRATRAGYRWRTVAENVAAGYTTPAAVVAAWMASPSHRSTILAPEPVHAGVGHAFRSGGQLHHFWTLLVAAPLERGAGVTAACHP